MGLGSLDIAGMGTGMVNVALGAIIAVVVVGLGAMVWVNRDKFHDAKALLSLAALLAMIPLGALLVKEKTDLLPSAAEEVKVVAVEVKRVTDKSAVVIVTLSEPGFAFLDYKDLETGRSRPVVVKGKVEKRFGHTFEIEDVGPKGGDARLVVNGKPERIVRVR